MIVPPAGTAVSSVVSAQLVSVKEASMPSDLTRTMSLTGALASGVGEPRVAAGEVSGAMRGPGLIEAAGDADAVDARLLQESGAIASKHTTPIRAPLRIGRRS